MTHEEPTTRYELPSVALDDAGLRRFRRSVINIARVLLSLRPDLQVTPTMLATVRAVQVLTERNERRPSMGEVSDYLGITAPSLTRTVTALEAVKLVRRESDPADGRRMVIALSAPGLAMIRATSELRRAWLLDRFAAMTAEDIETILAANSAMERLLEGVEIPRL